MRYATKGSPEALRSARIAITNIERLARKGSPTKALKESYQQLIAAAENGTAEELEKACRVAIEEKSRYVAQRIIRTETARAYADGFVAKMDADDDVVAVRLRLSTRHPVFDICDFFADADMYGLGKGVYPKDKAPPIPLHPHCMCWLEEVFSWELDISKAKNQVKQAGNKWLNGLTDRERREVLGIEGDKAWKEGENWQKYLRNWKGLAKPETRLANLMNKNLVPPTDEYIKTLADKQGLVYTIGKKGNERFYADDGSPIYPPNDGFVGKPEKVTLKAGEQLVDRYGPITGGFVSPIGTSLKARALPDNITGEYTVFAVKTDIADVLSGRTAPWFGEPGGGTQYRLPQSTKKLLRAGYMEVVKHDN